MNLDQTVEWKDVYDYFAIHIEAAEKSGNVERATKLREFFMDMQKYIRKIPA